MHQGTLKKPDAAATFMKRIRHCVSFVRGPNPFSDTCIPVCNTWGSGVTCTPVCNTWGTVLHAYLYATLGAAVLLWSHIIIILIVSRRLQTNAVIVEPIIAVVTRQHGAQLIVGLLAQAVDLGALLHVCRSIAQLDARVA